MNDRYGDPDEPVWKPPVTHTVEIAKPDWFDELAAHYRAENRHRWFTDDGQHRAYLGAKESSR